jgi:hypothetical protein
MSKDIFKEELTVFFRKNAKRKLKFVDSIANQFSGKEKEILVYLHEKFKTGKKYDGYFSKTITHQIPETVEVNDENSEENNH